MELNKNSFKKDLIIVVGVIVLGVLLVGLVNYAFAGQRYHYPQPRPRPIVCEGGDTYSVMQECPPTLTPTMTVEPTITPTDVPEVTPTETPGDKGNPPTFQGSTTDAPVCSDTVPGKVANIFVDTGTPNDGKLEVRWLSDEPKGNKAHVRYSEDDGLWRYGVINIENDGVEEIAGLTNGTHYWFQVAQVNGCMVGPWSQSFDPLP